MAINKNIRYIYPLTPLQEGMYYAAALESGKNNYHIQNQLAADRRIDYDLLERTMAFLAEKHEVLKTAFAVSKAKGEVRQLVLENRTVEVSRRCFDCAYNERTMENVRRTDLERSFDLKNDSLMRAALLSFSDRDILLLSYHHIIMDGWCTPIILGDIKSIYDSLAAGVTDAEMSERIEREKLSAAKYSEYVRWLYEQDTEAGLDFWSGYLDGCEGGARIKPFDRIEHSQKLDGEQVLTEYLSFTPEESARLADFCTRYGVSHSSTIETAVGVLLRRMSYTDDVVFGKVVSGRNAAVRGIEDTVGMFINTVPVRFSCDEKVTPVDAVKAQQRGAMLCSEYDFCPLAEIQSRTDTKSGLTKVLYIYENYYTDRSRQTDGIQLESQFVREQTDSDITIMAYNSDGLFGMHIMYDPMSYSAECIRIILCHLKDIVMGMCQSPEGMLEEAAAAPDEKLLQEFNGTTADYPKAQALVELFERQAESTPDNIAVVFEDERLTYAQLNARANSLADKLRKMGVMPDDFVAVIAERSIDMICGVYAILKAGGAYVPIAPDYPKERIGFILEDSKPKAILVYNAKVNTDIPVIDLADSEVWEGAPENLPTVNKPEDLAYCIYTSGTTGKPKGVAVCHRNAVNYCADTPYSVLRPAFEKGLRAIAAVTNLTFDIHVTELILPLLHGMTIVLANKDEQESSAAFADLMTRHPADILQTTPSRIKLWLASGGGEDCLGCMKYIMLGGERVDSAVVEQIRSISNADIADVYGPSETTVWSSVWQIPSDYSGEISVGQPISNTQIYILRGTALCGIGMPGELCIAGDGVARGYVNRPELTSEKFIANPFGEGRLYRTGDLARLLPDGNIDYLGRIDEQVKIRGFRIELGEIESKLRELEYVRDCAVIARDDSSGDKAIYAYIVSDTNAAMSDVREALKKSLPEYMLPSYMMQIDTIPVTSNGKLDKRALPDIESRSVGEYAAPSTETERIICGIFAEILGCERVGANDSFFELGGHSLRATRLVNRIEAETGHRIALREVFANTTPHELAALVSKNTEGQYERIPLAQQQDYYPMSSTQKRTYLVCQMDGSGIAYNMPNVYRLTGEVDEEKLRSAVQNILDRHEILRTQFITRNGEPIQHLLPHIDADFEYMTDTQTDEKTLVNRFIRPFDLSCPPLVRTRLIKRSEGYLLMLDMHHIVADGMSISVFMSELSALYSGKTLAPLDRQYKDYSQWMRTRDLSAHKEFWKGRFDDEIPTLDLPTDFARPQEQSFNGGCVSAQTDAKLYDGIKALSAKTGATEYMIFLAAAMVLLSKYSRQEDIVIGSPISGRTHKDTEGMLGMFVNTLALRGKPENDKTFTAFLSEIKEACLLAYEHQEYPFEELVEAVEVKRDLSRNPLFDVMLVMQNTEQAAPNLGGARAEVIETEDTVSKFDLTFNIVQSEAKKCYSIALEYCTDLFRGESAELMAQRLVTLLGSILDHPEQKLCELSMLTDSERRTVVYDFNNTAVEYSRDKTVVDLFEQQADTTPDAVAVEGCDRSLTYSELNRSANAIACRLIADGVKAGDVVAVHMSRSRWLMPSILGALKAGATYLPIATDLPQARVSYIINDSSAVCVLCDQENEALCEGINARFVNVRSITEQVEYNPRVSTSPTDGSYIIYTSGSTGTPKGTVLTQSGLYNFCKNNTEIIGSIKRNQNPIMLSTTTISFDIFVTESLMSICNGITMVLATEDEQVSQRDVAALAERARCTALQTTPSKMRMYMEDRSNCGYLRAIETIILGGEVFPASLYTELRKYTDAEIFNIYGPSEATVWITTKRVEDERVNIGKPIANTQIYILSGERLCGIGVPGELCVAGDCLGKGYLNRPELTAEKFIYNPFGEGKLYRTGDLARLLPNGDIEYMGRIDQQVKIRGLRIELGEIESRIRQLADVRDCAVIAKDDAAGEKAIYAYIVSDQSMAPSTVREALRKTLPEYMIPAYMAQIDAVPVTRNGKLDRKALPDIEGASGSEYVAPATEAERLICEIFAGILGCERVGANDGFFELGGHSLSATRLINRIEAETGHRITLRQVFAGSTPHELAALVGAGDEESYEHIPLAQKRDRYPMSDAQKNVYIIQTMQPDSTAYNMPYAVELDSVDHTALERALQSLVQRHETLRTAFSEQGGEYLQTISNNVTIRLEQASVEGFCRPFDLSVPPLMRAAISQVGGKDYLLLDIHHIITDGASIGILIDELSRLYNGDAPDAPTLHYKDYSEWMRTRDFSDSKAFWEGYLSDELPYAELKTDYPRPKLRDLHGKNISVDFDEQLSSGLRSLCAQTGCTEFMVLISTLMLMLSRYGESERVSVGTQLSCRVHRDVERMLGMFNNTVVFREDVPSGGSFRDFLLDIKRRSLSIFEHQDYSFDRLCDRLVPERIQGRTPLFDVMFVYQNNETGSLSFGAADQSAAARLFAADQAKFDLSVTAFPKGEGYGVYFSYCTALYSEETVKGFADRYVQMLRLLCDTPDIQIGELEMCSDRERDTILNVFNNTAAPYKSDMTLSQLLEEQAALTPDAVALVCGERRLTYAQLNCRANKLARLLRDKGLTPNSYAAIITERGIELIVSMYAVLKAGGAYVWIDPTFPEQRKRWLLEDCSAGLILLGKVSDDCRKQADGFGIEVIDALSEGSYIGDGENLPCVNTPDDVVYNLYTSGTTGKPKGVMITNRGVAYYCTSVRNGEIGRCIRREYESFISVTTPSYAIFANESFIPLSNGMKVIMATEEEKGSADRMNRLMLREHAGCINTTPSRLRSYLTDSGSREFMKHLKLVMLAGERLTGDMLDEIRRYSPDCRVINGYGASESSMHSALYELNGSEGGSIPLGSPTDNSKLYVVDSHMRLVGIGVPGELCIGGPGVAKGYVGNAELTADKFIQNPFGEGRLYRTGDMARWRPDGNIEGLGRRDSQIKIRGMRVDLGEVESALRKIDGIDDAAVLARDNNGDKAICAFYISQAALSPEHIADALGRVLAAHMVPAFITRLDSFPLNQNGKLDAEKLRSMKVQSTGEYVSPVGETEPALAAMFAELLGVERIGATDDFFSLGGHSLLATRLVSMIHEQLGYSIGVNEVFDHPTVRSLAERLSQCTSEQRTITKAEEKAAYPLTPAQRLIYLHSQSAENPLLYNVPYLYRISGALDAARAKDALCAMMETHESLRTRYLLTDGDIVQIIDRSETADFETEQTDEDIFAVFERFIRPFDLAAHAPIRMKAVQSGSGSYLMIDGHHIIFDGTSHANFVAEWLALYSGEQPKPLDIQYRDYCEWLHSQPSDEDRDFWLERLSGDIPALTLPYKGARPARKDYSGDHISVEAPVRECVTKTAAAAGATEAMVMLSVFMLLLSKYSEQTDIAVGTMLAGRELPGTQRLIGMLANTVVLRADLSGEKTLGTLVGEMREQLLSAMKHQSYPLDLIVDRLGVSVDPSRNPLFDVMFIYHNEGDAAVSAAASSMLSYMNYGEKGSKYDLTVECDIGADGYTLRAEYATALFERSSIERLLEHYCLLLASAEQSLDLPLCSIDMLTENDRRCLEAFNSTAADYPRDKTIVELFERQVDKTPDSIAVVFEDEQLTYAQLNARANSLADKLRAMCVKPNDFVAVIAERSIEMLCGVYAILKSGGAYVPIAPDYPKERISFILEDSCPKAVLTYKAKAETDIPVIDLADRTVWEGNTENLPTVSKPESAAYCIYTSGTTGKPKGVVVSHRNTVNYCADTPYSVLRPAFEKGLGTIAAVTNLTFDIHVTELILPLLHGMTIILANRNEQERSIAFADLMSRHPADILQTTPSRIKLWLTSGGGEDCLGCMKYIMLGGERVDSAVIGQIRSVSNADIADVYGPSETTVWSSVWQIPKDYSGEISIGKPISNTQIYILRGTILCGVGIPGELCISGDGVAMGYINRPELTSEKFIDNPFGEGKLYRTGDLAILNADGTLRFIGRVDDQIKLNGNRIELGEIESAIRSFDGVTDAAVIVRGEDTQKLLCAYFTGHDRIDTAALRTHLGEKLPDYMVPSRMMQLDSLPVTASGKLDRKSLPEFSSQEDKPFVEPRTENERLLAALLCELLEVERVSMSDSFFELGGNSMKSVALITKLERMGLVLTMRDIRKSSSLGKLARRIVKQKEKR